MQTFPPILIIAVAMPKSFTIRELSWREGLNLETLTLTLTVVVAPGGLHQSSQSSPYSEQGVLYWRQPEPSINQRHVGVLHMLVTSPKENWHP